MLFVGSMWIRILLGTLLLVGSSPARASVTEPNNLVVPVLKPYPGYTETSLATFFASQGEAIDAVQDANSQPAAFMTLCDFTATFVLNQAGNHFGIGWYNVIPGATSAPTAAQIHTIIPANSPVGTLVTSANIRTDPSYAGGAVGFALLGGEIHYTESKWDTDCTGCATHIPWVTALIYKSTRLANSYYVAFEDGATSATSWNNDGDFNDDVFLVSGLACAGGGVACQTGLLGICADGVTECDATGALMCKQNLQPTAEVCNGLDDDCNGQIDDGATCTGNNICVRGQCVPPCGSVEFPCSGNLVCDKPTMTCLDPACVSVTCANGQVCVTGHCQGGCVGVTCPAGQVCRIGRCVDPCAGITCSHNNVCVNGACVPSCACLPCAAGLACTSNGQCKDPACAAMATGCASGTTCVAGGMCVDGCQGVVCPSGQQCSSGHCVDLPPADMAVGPPASDLGIPISDAGVSVADGAGVTGGGDAGGTGGITGSTFAAHPAGCQCRAAPPDRRPSMVRRRSSACSSPCCYSFACSEGA